MFDAVRHAIKLGKRKESRLLTKAERAQGIRLPKDVQSERIRQLKGAQPFPNVYTLIHTSPAFRTKRGKIRPAVMTFAVDGQGNRRVRLTRPWRVGDESLDIPRVPIGKVGKLTKGGLHAILKRREKAVRFEESLSNLEKGLEGPSAAFFKE